MFLHEEPDQCRFPVLEPGFTSTEIQELLAFIQNDEPERSNSVIQNDEPERSNSVSWSSRTVHSIDERKKRRMISNRESARRSRLKRKRHLENLTNQVSQLRAENRAYKNRLGLVMHHYQLVRRDTDRIRSEAVALCTKLSELYQILLTMQLQ